MYLPNSFKEDNLEVLHDFMRQNNFAVVISQKDGSLEASHLPLLLDAERGPHGTLVGHLARANPLWRSFAAQQEILVVFQGPHAYVSPSWYEEMPSVPTWNYAVVHAYCKPTIIEDFERLEILLKNLVDTHEAGYEEPWQMNLPEDYLHNMMRAIVGFEFEITRLEGKFKLSQNRSLADQKQVVHALENNLDQTIAGVAELMDKRLANKEVVR